MSVLAVIVGKLRTEEAFLMLFTDHFAPLTVDARNTTKSHCLVACGPVKHPNSLALRIAITQRRISVETPLRRGTVGRSASRTPGSLPPRERRGHPGSVNRGGVNRDDPVRQSLPGVRGIRQSHNYRSTGERGNLFCSVVSSIIGGIGPASDILNLLTYRQLGLQ